MSMEGGLALCLAIIAASWLFAGLYPYVTRQRARRIDALIVQHRRMRAHRQFVRTVIASTIAELEFDRSSSDHEGVQDVY